MSIQSINPATEEVLETFEPYTDEQIDNALQQAHTAFDSWSRTSFAERSALFHRLASHLRENKARLARTATLEMGKPIVEAESEVEKCALNCDYYADHAEMFLAPQEMSSNATKSYVAFRPLGVVLALMPWNFPYWQVMRFAAPGLMAGNTAVLKHASNVSRVALEIERMFEEVGFPKGVFRTVLVPGAETEKLIKDPRVAAVTLTGSEQAGIKVAEASGSVLKKHVLELGGSDAYIVLADADLDEAAKTAVQARNQNNGQSCIAAKRFIVVGQVYDEFVEKFVKNTRQLHIGDPLERETKIGPLARKDLRETLEQQVQASLSEGARLATGGKRFGDKGYYYEPTILVDVTPAMTVFKEETFGPMAAVIRARDADHAIELANDSIFGLSSNLWTRDIELAQRLAARIEAGGVFINGMTASAPSLPFGGVKHSGYGRELSHFGIQEFVNVQTVWIGPKVEETPTRSPAE
ncbi:NAD-dependent succinate-semialdehyde dehydrogenase [Dictyobacter aurantiacus]|uniref:Succinate-semialdehyde dehydrogenase n=1 Tax=Dictyobacter aurantiacus TaxID=1936993 RepID=A0A401ZG68_9CHLR|nr:NAD-dependent succinate-semialdehyde dehydrogenase [Dictyobacter aurantiacus]GCE05836.1 succinate-semialdehyde dehydrogenase [Dictyobacter aurantiacus]